MLKKRSLCTVDIFVTAIILFFLLVGLGCAGSTVEYNPNVSNFIGKQFHFKKPMVYLVFINKDAAKKYGFLYPKYGEQEIIRDLVDTCTAKELVDYNKLLLIENIEDGMAFTIKGSFWVRHDLIKREFAPEYQKIILQDKNNTISTFMIDRDTILDSLKSNTDFGDH